MIAARRRRKASLKRKPGTGQSVPLTPRQRAALQIAIRAAARANRLRGNVTQAKKKRRRRKRKSA